MSKRANKRKRRKLQSQSRRSNQRDWVEFILGEDNRIYARGNHPEDILDLLIERINNPRNEVQRMSNKILGTKRKIHLEIKLLNLIYDDRFGYINDTAPGGDTNPTQGGSIILGISDSNGAIREYKIRAKRI